MKGIDISSYQGNVDFNQVKSDGVEVVIIKASEGMTWKDSNFAKYYDGAKAAGLKVGVYHFLRANESQNEVDNLLSVIGDRKFDCKIVIDAETDFGSVDFNSSKVRQFANILISKGFEVCLYSGEYFYNRNLNDTVKDLPLWIAKYSDNKPSVGKDYVGWQYSDNGSVSGIQGNVDMNDFSEGILSKLVEIPQPQVIQRTWELFVQGDLAIELQKACNSLGLRDKNGNQLDIDGKLGDRSNEAMEHVWLQAPINEYNSLLKAVQHRLMSLGYALPNYGADGKMSLAGETGKAIEQFQRDRGLDADKIVGPLTIKELYRK